MKRECKNWKVLVGAILCMGVFLCDTPRLQAQELDVIADGVFVDGIDVSGMTLEEATAEVAGFVEELKDKKITLHVVGNQKVTVTTEQLGLKWENTQMLQEAISLGKTGNIVQRYKAMKELKYENKIYPLQLSYDESKILKILQKKCAKYDIPVQNAYLSKVGSVFLYHEGHEGEVLNIEESLVYVYDYLKSNKWNYADADLMLLIDVVEDRGSQKELSVVRDLLGTYTSSYASSGKERRQNVENGCRLLNSKTIYPGETFSTLECLVPFTEENGYYAADSYLNGRVVESLGGGICQVSTTLYNALLQAELQIKQRNAHSMMVNYVKPSFDAAIAESSGKDLKFVNSTEYPIYIEGYVNQKKVTFNIYGVETRPTNRKVKYENEILTTTLPDHEEIILDETQPVGYIDVTAAHIGYTAQLWKIVEEDGEEISREVVNRSTYTMSPRIAVVGIQSEQTKYVKKIKNAAKSGEIDTVKKLVTELAKEMED